MDWDRTIDSFSPFEGGRMLRQHDLFDPSNPQKRVVSILTLNFSLIAAICSILTLALI